MTRNENSFLISSGIEKLKKQSVIMVKWMHRLHISKPTPCAATKISLCDRTAVFISASGERLCFYSVLIFIVIAFGKNLSDSSACRLNVFRVTSLCLF